VTVKPLELDGSGNLLVNVAVGGGGGGGTQYAEGSTTSPATGTLALGRYQTPAPTLTNGQIYGLQLDSAGRLLTNVAPFTGSADSIAINDGTNTANVVTGDYNGLAINSTSKVIPFTTSTPGAQTLLANTDCRGYTWISVMFTGVGTGLALSGSWSATTGGTYISSINTWNNTALTTNAVSSLTINTTSISESPVMAPFFQLAVSALTSGTVTGFVILSSLPHAYHTMGVSAGQNGTWNVGVAASTTGGYSFNNITTATTTTVKSGAGTLHAIVFNTIVASATVTVYDNTTATGTKIGTYTLPSTITSDNPFEILYDAAFATGLTIVTSGATDITALYK
jgi:hypothetical protein